MKKKRNCGTIIKIGQSETGRGELIYMAKKEKKKGNTLYRIIFVVLIIIIAFCLYKIGTILYEYHVGTKEYDSVQKLAGIEAEAFTGEVDFDALAKKNEDVKGWIYSKDTVINYPVVQGGDNQYYLYRMINGEYNNKGSIFIDYRCEKPFESFNTIIYGHRMKDGSMFNSLTKYRDKSYFNEHKTLMLVTPEKKYDIVVFGVVTIPSDSEMYKYQFYSTEEKTVYLDWIRSNSEIDTGVKASKDDKIVMLSTCTYEFEDARLVVYGKLVEMEEDK